MAKHQSKPQRAPRQCIFCDERFGSSPEHIWPKWMGRYFERTPHAKSIQHWERIGPDKSGAPPSKIYHGNTVTTKVKGACKDCNNGWMSVLETAARPYIEPMLHGRRVTLDPDGQRRVVEWLTLKMIVWEQTHLESVIFTRDQTLAFARQRTIPAHTKIWLFRSREPNMRARVIRAYASVYPTGEVPRHLPVCANIQTVMFRAGKLVAYFLHTHLPDLEVGDFRQTDAKRLLPPRGRFATWPPINSITRTDEDHIARTLSRYLERPGNVAFD